MQIMYKGGVASQLIYLFEGFLHKKWQDGGCATSLHPKGWLLPNNRNAEYTGEGTG
jgi:hypothetical protein